MKLKIKLAQINLIVGDLKNNFQKIKSLIQEAKNDKTDIVIFPEMAITSYYPEDLLYKRTFIQENINILNKITPLCDKLMCIIGFVRPQADKLFNSAAVIYNRRIQYTYDKINLPNYSVFDEKRHFEAGEKIPIIQLKNIRFGLGICEDIWVEDSPIEVQNKFGKPNFIININSSPYYLGKYKERKALLSKIAKRTKSVVFYLNLIGGQDEVVFDGNSLILDPSGNLLKAGKQFEEEIINTVIDFKETKVKINKKLVELVRLNDFKPHDHSDEPIYKKPVPFQFLPLEAEIYKALVTGTRDYVQKNKFTKVIIGLSGGVDSALTAVIAVDAIGKENVMGLFMPSKFSSSESYLDAKKLAENLGINLKNITIKKIHKLYLKILQPLFKKLPLNITEENIQARIRGNMLMAISNKFGYLVLTTGNKSEMSTGYTTLYGDLAGGFAVIKDVYKTMVYRLVNYRNKMAGDSLIPANIISKAPTAELRKNQKDSDSLPEYPVLDEILYYYIEEHLTYADIIKLKKYDPKMVRKVSILVDKSEYKRRQSPPGIKITKLSFGKDRRMPITNGYTLFS